MDWSDVALEQYQEDLYREHEAEALKEFTAERLSSYYDKNTDIAKPSFIFREKAKQLVKTNPESGFILAAISNEYAIKNVFLRPIIYGLVHTESSASFISDLMLSRSSMDRYRDLLFHIINEHGGFDLKNHMRNGIKITIWEEIKAIQSARDKMVHRADLPNHSLCATAYRVNEEILYTIFPSVMVHLGYHLHQDFQICSKWECSPESPLA